MVEAEKGAAVIANGPKAYAGFIRRAGEAKREYIRRWGKAPGCLYLGTNQSTELARLLDGVVPWMKGRAVGDFAGAQERLEYDGMKVYLVDEGDHLAVS